MKMGIVISNFLFFCFGLLFGVLFGIKSIGNLFVAVLLITLTIVLFLMAGSMISGILAAFSRKDEG